MTLPIQQADPEIPAGLLSMTPAYDPSGPAQDSAD